LYSNRQLFVFQLPIILSRNNAILSGKYEAWIAIFRIFAAIDRFSRISQKVESRWGKLESRWRNQKAVSESGKPLRKIGKPLKKLESRFRKRKAIEEIGKPLKKLESRWRRFSRISQKWESRWRKSNFERGKSDLTRGFQRDYLVTHFGSWIQVGGTWIGKHGSWIQVGGTWIAEHGSWC
jgi:hypothetical protein